MERKQNPAKTPSEKVLSKVVVRCLPPSITEEQFIEQVQPLPPNDYFVFVGPDLSLGPYAYSRVYLNFLHTPDIYIFRDKFDGYVFVDTKGHEYPAVVEFSPYQKIPKPKKKDDKAGTLENEADFLKFLEDSEKPESVLLPSTQTILEELEEKDKERRNPVHTPLVDYLNRRSEEKAKLRDEKREERRKREVERKQKREEEKTKRMAAIEKGKKTIKEEEEWEEWDEDYEDTTYYARRKETSSSWKDKKSGKETEKKGESKSSKDKKVDDKLKQKEEEVAGKDQVKKDPSESSYKPARDPERSKGRTDPRLERANREREKRMETKPKAEKDKQKVEEEPERQESAKRGINRPDKWPERKARDDQASERAKPREKATTKPEKSARFPAEKADEKRKTKEESGKVNNEGKDAESKKPKPVETKQPAKVKEVSDVEVTQLSVSVADLEISEDGKPGNKENNEEGESRSLKRESKAAAERRLRNKDRPSLEIYRPGMRRTKGIDSKEETVKADEPSEVRESPNSQDEGETSNAQRAETSKAKSEVRTRTFRRSVPRD